MIWDFRGPGAKEVARHHAVHLKEYAAAESLPELTGVKDLSDLHSTAFLVVNEGRMPAVRDALKPHRGEVYSG